jgi:hypothetical protein
MDRVPDFESGIFDPKSLECVLWLQLFTFFIMASTGSTRVAPLLHPTEGKNGLDFNFLGKETVLEVLNRIQTYNKTMGKMIILVTYDLNKPGTDYASVYEAIKNSARVGGTVLIQRGLLKQTISSTSFRCTSDLDSTDQLLVADITDQPRQGWLTEEAWDWWRNNDG